MTDRRTFVIVGASLTGAKAAETLRAAGFDGRVVLVGEESDRPYERPALSKTFLRAESSADDAYVHASGFYTDNGIELRLDTLVESVDVRERAVRFDDGVKLRYDSVLLATGSRPRELRVPGADLPGVHYLRTLRDAQALRDAVRGATRVAVIGAGWIGSEVAASIRQLGVDVAIVDPAPLPLLKVLGPEVGTVYRDLHAEHGVELHLGAGIDAFAGDHAVEGVRMSDGSVISADLAIVGVGAEPRLDLAYAAGLDIEGGIAVNEYLESSVPGVFAAGDVAAAWHPSLGRRIRVEHWANALNQGVAAAKNMLGAAIPYQRLPYFFSDQYDLGMEYTGYAPSWDRVVFRGEPATREFVAFYMTGDRVSAALNANVWEVTEPLKALVTSKRPVRDAQLADSGVPIDALVGAAA